MTRVVHSLLCSSHGIEVRISMCRLLQLIYDTCMAWDWPDVGSADEAAKTSPCHECTINHLGLDTFCKTTTHLCMCNGIRKSSQVVTGLMFCQAWKALLQRCIVTTSNHKLLSQHVTKYGDTLKIYSHNLQVPTLVKLAVVAAGELTSTSNTWPCKPDS